MARRARRRANDAPPGKDRFRGTNAISRLSGIRTDGDKWFFRGSPLARQGWKLYISASVLNFEAILEAIAPILDRHGVPFKYVAGEKTLRMLNAGLLGYSQIGKCIVAYLGEAECAASLLPRLKQAVGPFVDACPEVPYARQLGAGLPLSYRYGAYDSSEVTINGTARMDDRGPEGQPVPEGLDDPLAAFAEPVESDAAFAAFLTEYPLFDVISQAGKGGVFLGFDLSQPVFTEVIVKIGYRNGQTMPDGGDGFALLRREASFFAELAAAGLEDIAPAFIVYREFRGKNALVMERLPGDNLMTVRGRGELTALHIESCLDLLQQAHRCGLYVGDPKLPNFVLDAEGNCRAIDFECAGRIAPNLFDPMRTFVLVNPRIEDLPTLDVAHFLFSVLYETKSDASFSESDRLIDISAVLGRPAPDDPVAAMALERFREVLAKAIPPYRPCFEDVAASRHQDPE